MEPDRGAIFRRTKLYFSCLRSKLRAHRTLEALVCGTKRFTYRELSGRAAGVAKNLRASGVGNQSLVGVCLERSEEMVAAILGTLQAGGAYVPLDPAYPKSRLAFIAKDAGLRVVLTRRALQNLLPESETISMCVEDLQPLEDSAAVRSARRPV